MKKENEKLINMAKKSLHSGKIYMDVTIDPREPFTTDLISRYDARIRYERNNISEPELTHELNRRLKAHGENLKAEDFAFRKAFLDNM